MRFLRGLAGALLWLLASVLGLVGVLLCVTVLLLPVGLFVLRIARRMYTRAVALMLPRAMSHPVEETTKQLPRSKRSRLNPFRSSPKSPLTDGHLPKSSKGVRKKAKKAKRAAKGIV